MPCKPARYGIEYHACCNVRSSYTYNTEIFARNQPNGSPYRVSNTPEDIVLRLLWPIQNQAG